MTRSRNKPNSHSDSPRRTTNSIPSGSTDPAQSMASVPSFQSESHLRIGNRSWEGLLSWPAVVLWSVLFASLSTRQHLVLMYDAYASLPWQWEALAASVSMIVLGLVFAALWLVRFQFILPKSPASARWSLFILWAGVGLVLVSNVAARISHPLHAHFVDPILLAFSSGLSVAFLFPKGSSTTSRRSSGGLIVMVACLLAGVTWWLQASRQLANFSLGFNDVGHFAQRVASTAQGNGFLLESPTLPPFWDHFNPGLVLMVPLWWLWPSVELFLLVQAICLASGGWFFWRIAKELNLGTFASIAWGVGWILHPAVSQMNVAYTYGWHPVTLALPFLLWSLLRLIQGGRWSGLGLALIAASFEENVIVLITLWCAMRALRGFVGGRLSFEPSKLDGRLGWPVWLAASMVGAAIFVLVYQWSGLARFQTGRFASLGSTPWEIMASPILKPDLFWHRLLEYRSWMWMACLWIPCFVPSTLRGWSIWPVVILPSMVLLVWEHVPAKSIAFQYPTTILPVLWLSSMVGSTLPRGSFRSWFSEHGQESPVKDEVQVNHGSQRPLSVASAVPALVTSLILTTFVGQMPWSRPTLSDVETMTYGLNSSMNRHRDSEDGKWLHRVIEDSQFVSIDDAVLCTGRIATHFVGHREVETVGQFIQRRDDLDRLPEAPSNALLRYQAIFLDRREAFQQSVEETAKIESEAKSLGFRTSDEAFDMIVLTRPEK